MIDPEPLETNIDGSVDVSGSLRKMRPPLGVPFTANFVHRKTLILPKQAPGFGGESEIPRHASQFA